jgi:hypothetical protein
MCHIDYLEAHSVRHPFDVFERIECSDDRDKWYPNRRAGASPVDRSAKTHILTSARMATTSSITLRETLVSQNMAIEVTIFAFLPGKAFRSS